MDRQASKNPLGAEKHTQLAALACLLLLGGLALAGPYGVLAWGENRALLEKREKQIAALEQEAGRLENLVALLDPNQVDSDLSTELLRRDLNVAHPDEYIIELPAR